MHYLKLLIRKRGIAALACAMSLLASCESPQSSRTHSQVQNRARIEDLFQAALKGDLAEVSKLLREHPDWLNKPDTEGRTVIVYARPVSFYPFAPRQYVETLRHLIVEGAQVNAVDKFGNSPLHFFCD